MRAIRRAERRALRRAASVSPPVMRDAHCKLDARGASDGPTGPGYLPLACQRARRTCQKGRPAARCQVYCKSYTTFCTLDVVQIPVSRVHPVRRRSPDLAEIADRRSPAHDPRPETFGRRLGGVGRPAPNECLESKVEAPDFGLWTLKLLNVPPQQDHPVGVVPLPRLVGHGNRAVDDEERPMPRRPAAIGPDLLAELI